MKNNKKLSLNVLWQKSERIALALSGGVDSVVLFHLLVTEYRESYKELVVFHINHGLRRESYEEAEFVENFVRNYDVKFYKKELEMNNLERTAHISEEMLARSLRYEAFNEFAEKENITKVLTAHHKNDQVENILLRLLSGRSMDYNLTIESEIKMGGITLFRPLLGVLKSELEEYAHKNNLKYYVDATNFDTDYTRNNIRHNIVPLLNDVNEASFDNLINFAKYYKNLNEQFKDRVLSDKTSYILESSKDKVVFNRDRLLKLTKEELYFILKDTIAEKFQIFDIKQRALMNVAEEIKGNFGNKSYDLKKNLKIVSEYSAIYIHKIEKKCYNDKMELIIDEICENRVYKFHQSEFLITTSNNEAEIGFNKEDLPLRITTKRAGDRIMRGEISKKLSRFFIDEKVPKELRTTLPIVRKDNEVLGILGVGTRVNKNKIYDYYIKMKG